jgi:TatD DNase family protein
MTNLPSHFARGIPFFKSQKKIRLALGMHPLYSDRHDKEFPIFLNNLDKTSYIGEIGLDFSKDGYQTKKKQIETFERILKVISNQKKILSIHSRAAEKKVLELLIENKIQNAIFHWYSGPEELINEILNAGYYFSINPSMVLSKHGQSLISQIPIKKVLTESDGPFVKVANRTIHPKDVHKVIEYISGQTNCSFEEIQRHIQANFNELINKIR